MNTGVEGLRMEGKGGEGERRGGGKRGGKGGVGLPGTLPEIGALPGSLEKRPLLQEVLLGRGGVGQLVLFVVGVDEVGDDGAGFPERDVRVWVFDCCWGG